MNLISILLEILDGSSFCDELGIELQELYFRHPEENASLVILGNYEDLDQMQVYSSIANSIDSKLTLLFLKSPR